MTCNGLALVYAENFKMKLESCEEQIDVCKYFWVVRESAFHSVNSPSNRCVKVFLHISHNGLMLCCAPLF